MDNIGPTITTTTFQKDKLSKITWHFWHLGWDFYDIRRRNYSVENFKVLFRDVPPDKIFSFLKEAGIFYKI